MRCLAVVALVSGLIACAGSEAPRPRATPVEDTYQLRVQKAQAAWAQQIVMRVRRAWSMPPGIPPDFACTVRVQLAGDGRVIEASLSRACGSEAIDASVLAAVWSSSPMPLPTVPEAFDPELIIHLCPRPGPSC